MAFFQNLFNQEFRGNWVMGDRQYSLTFTCPANRNTQLYQVAYNSGPWDVSVPGNELLTINYSWDKDFKNYTPLTIDITGDDSSETKKEEVVSILNSNSEFSSIFTAEVEEKLSSISIRTKQTGQEIKVWISNTGAEKKLRFNKYAGVAELPLYFERHTIENRLIFPDSAGQLILLDETDNDIDIPIIEEAGFIVEEMKKDWELLEGRASGLFTFQKLTVDGSDRITQIIEYPAGAKVGDFARRITYSYTGSNSNPSQVTEEPHTLTSGDLVTP